MECIVFLNFNQLPAAKKGFKNGASQQTFGPFYFDRALTLPLCTNYSDSETVEGLKIRRGVAGCQKGYWMKQILLLNLPKSGR